jgi:hypothetical protein
LKEAFLYCLCNEVPEGGGQGLCTRADPFNDHLSLKIGNLIIGCCRSILAAVLTKQLKAANSWCVLLARAPTRGWLMRERAFATPIDKDYCIDQFVAYDKPFDPSSEDSSGCGNVISRQSSIVDCSLPKKKTRSKAPCKRILCSKVRQE